MRGRAGPGQYRLAEGLWSFSAEGGQKVVEDESLWRPECLSDRSSLWWATGNHGTQFANRPIRGEERRNSDDARLRQVVGWQAGRKPEMSHPSTRGRGAGAKVEVSCDRRGQRGSYGGSGW